MLSICVKENDSSPYYIGSLFLLLSRRKSVEYMEFTFELTSFLYLYTIFVDLLTLSFYLRSSQLEIQYFMCNVPSFNIKLGSIVTCSVCRHSVPVAYGRWLIANRYGCHGNLSTWAAIATAATVQATLVQQLMTFKHQQK